MISYPENYRPIDRQNNTFIIYVKKVFDHGKKKLRSGFRGILTVAFDYLG